jgi:hypothetical protein
MKPAKKKSFKMPAAKQSSKRAAKKPADKKKSTTRRAKVKSKPVSLGRPKVTAEEKLYMLFKDDYQARQLFEFLRVESVGELEQFTPDQIVERLTRPMRQTVERIRLVLAEKNRSLRDDQRFAQEHRGEM